MTENRSGKPEILAPAGGRAAFLAALAAGADAIYCGLKQFSARMAAENFTIGELASLGNLAREKQTRLYVALNTMIKPDETGDAGKLLARLVRNVAPDGLIVSDTAVLSLASQAGYKGEIHLSTLANIGFPGALKIVRRFSAVSRIVMPRELSIDEMREMADACPEGISLEAFVHGALCYAVSGRCYWSSYLGGKSGLRGNCVQPCRRVYVQNNHRGRLFSCQDLWLDVLTKVLLTVPRISALKIEGRKKGPHYVFYTVKAYKMLRDNPGDKTVQKSALRCLEYALGRGGTHYHFLTQRPWNPIDGASETASGQLVGKIQGTMLKPYIEPRRELFAKDVLRIGYEDAPGHRIYHVTKSVPKRGRLFLNLSKKERAVNKTPVFLVDRREPDLHAEIESLEGHLKPPASGNAPSEGFRVRMPGAGPSKRFRAFDVHVSRKASRSSPGRDSDGAGAWISPELPRMSGSRVKQTWWWLPPVIWPAGEREIERAIGRVLDMGGVRFVLNAPWQAAFFSSAEKLILWAGPFCNVANSLAISNLADLGCRGVVVSPELGEADYIRLAEESPLPLGVVVYGNWPLCISRIKSGNLKTETPFASPRKEQAWVQSRGDNYWVYPDWPIDLRDKAGVLKKAGYKMFVHLHETFPASVPLKKRPGKWNWDVGLK